jgi:XRE family aerobic/anaerobic benzoate catabolism transcriptional regulator
MDDLRRILKGRAAFYSKADLVVDTAGQSLQQSFHSLLEALGNRPPK